MSHPESAVTRSGAVCALLALVALVAGWQWALILALILTFAWGVST